MAVYWKCTLNFKIMATFNVNNLKNSIWLFGSNIFIIVLCPLFRKQHRYICQPIWQQNCPRMNSNIFSRSMSHLIQSILYLKFGILEDIRTCSDVCECQQYSYFCYSHLPALSLTSLGVPAKWSKTKSLMTFMRGKRLSTPTGRGRPLSYCPVQH